MPKITRIRIVETQQTLLAAPALLNDDLAWVMKRGVDVERLVENSISTANVSEMLPNKDALTLPLILVDGNVALSGRYPTREEMGIWMMFGFVPPEEKNTGGVRCCTL